MNYITEFNMAAVAIDLLLIVIFAARRNYPCTNTRIYFVMLLCATLASVFDLISSYTIMQPDLVPIWLNYVINIVYLWSYNMASVAFLVYVCGLTHPKNFPKWVNYMVFGIICADTLLLLTTPFTGWIINFDGGQYSHGPLFPVLYITSVFMLSCVGAFFMKYKKNISVFQSALIVVFVVAIVGAILVQSMNRELLIQNFVIALYLMLVYISLQNPDDYFDKETMCFNRRAFYETAGRHIDRKQPFTIVAFTVDEFQYMNRLIGGEAYSELIGNTAQFLCEKYGKKSVYHLEDNRFGLILDGRERRSADTVVEDIRDFFKKPVCERGIEVQITPYICTLNYPEFRVEEDDIRDALEYSVREMARTREKNIVNVTAEALNEKRRETKVIHAMRRAMRLDGFDVYYQPIYSVKNGSFRSAEALIRLKDDELGFISPDEFIPIAEKNGMIIEIGDMVFRTVCSFMANGEADKLGIDYIEVNLSAVQCMQENLAQKLMDVMNEYGIAAERINFEITETAHTVNEEVLHKNMSALINIGSSFSMDDYGTGFSTANYLISLPMKIVKIDKSILWPAMDDDDAMTILRHMVSMLHSLNKEIVVEGVETAKMAELLSSMGCDFLQGFLYSKPLPQGDFVKFLEKNAVSAQ